MISNHPVRHILLVDIRVANQPPVRGSPGYPLDLIENGAEVNTENNLGWTPLMNAAATNLEVLLARLLMEGADVNHFALNPKSCGEYNSSLDLAEMNKNLKNINALKKSGGLPGVELVARHFKQRLHTADRVQMKDLKNYPEKECGKLVKVECIISGFERSRRSRIGGEFEFTIDAEGSTVNMDGSENYRRGDGVKLFNFFLIPAYEEEISKYCHENMMDGKPHYLADIYALISSNKDQQHIGQIICMEFSNKYGKTIKTLK